MKIPIPSRRVVATLLSCTLTVGLVYAPQIVSAQAIPVQVQERDDGSFVLLRGGEPYEVRGASGYEFLDEAVAAGVTTLRTWGVRHLDDGRLLDEAHERGLTVLVGLWLGHKRDGFDYGKPEMVQRQFEEKAAIIRRFKDHPAVLAWGVGNEAEARGGKPWAAIEQLAQYIDEVDPAHPTVCIIAGASEAKLRILKEQAPSIDIVGVNVYRAYRVYFKVRNEHDKIGTANFLFLVE
ncbi:MAG: glycoside hydrolase family 2 TIM barrel-domain containing protein [Planctomycetota bacterium]